MSSVSTAQHTKKRLPLVVLITCRVGENERRSLTIATGACPSQSANKTFRRLARCDSVMNITVTIENSGLMSYTTGAILALHWGTLHRTIRTKDAAIAGFGAEQRLRAKAFVEELEGASWHRFAFGEAANRTYQHGFRNKLAHTRLSLPGPCVGIKSGDMQYIESR